MHFPTAFGPFASCFLCSRVQLTWIFFFWLCFETLLHSCKCVFFFFPLSLSLSADFRFDKERCTCEKDILNLSFPVRKAGGSDFKTVHLLSPLFFFFFFFFFFSSFVFNDFSLTTLRTNYHLPYPGHVVALHV